MATYSNYEVCHRFANGLAPQKSRNIWGRNFQSNNVFYDEDGRIYSYGYHFCMGRKIGGVLFYTLEGYSISTAKHQRYMLSAWAGPVVACASRGGSVSDRTAFDPNSEAFQRANFEAWENELKALCKSLIRARKPAKYISQIDAVCARVRAFCVACGCDVPAWVAEYAGGVSEAIRTQAREQMEQERERERERKRKEQEREAEQVERFERGEISYYYSDFQRVRYNAKSQRFETSKGVQIPREIGLRFYEALKGGTLKVWDKVLYYTVTEANDKVLKIGCHKFRTSYLLEYGSKFVATT